jgi:chaperonin cofactor prefoldin
LIFEDKISQLTQRLKDSEFQRRQTEDLLQKSRISYSNNLETLEYEIKSLRQATSPEVYLKEIDSLKKIVKDQNSEIERLSFELQDWKVNYQKLEELSLFLKKAPPKFEVQQKPIKELEENVERLSCKYKELLSRTRKQDENYPELRNELRQTAFELEYQSFLLFQQRKNEESSELRE